VLEQSDVVLDRLTGLVRMRREEERLCLDSPCHYAHISDLGK